MAVLFGGLACPGSGHSARSCAVANAPMLAVLAPDLFSRKLPFVHVVCEPSVVK
jgi:hypothetical protein